MLLLHDLGNLSEVKGFFAASAGTRVVEITTFLATDLDKNHINNILRDKPPLHYAPRKCNCGSGRTMGPHLENSLFCNRLRLWMQIATRSLAIGYVCWRPPPKLGFVGQHDNSTCT